MIVELIAANERIADLQESIKGCEYRMHRAEAATNGLHIAKKLAESHCKRISLERDALKKEIKLLKNKLAALGHPA